MAFLTTKSLRSAPAPAPAPFTRRAPVALAGALAASALALAPRAAEASPCASSIARILGGAKAVPGTKSTVRVEDDRDESAGFVRVVRREYAKGPNVGLHVEVDVRIQSPGVTWSNPFANFKDGATRTAGDAEESMFLVKGSKAVGTFDAKEKRGQVTVMLVDDGAHPSRLAGRVVVTANRHEKKELDEVVRSIDYPALTALAGRCGAVPEPPRTGGPVPAGWKTDVGTYNGENRPIMYAYPPTWSASREGIFRVAAPADGGTKAASFVRLQVQNRPGETLAAYAADSVKRTRQFETGYALVKSGATRLGGEPAFEHVYDSKMGPLSFRTRAVFVLKGATLYEFTYASDPGTFDRDATTAEQVMRSVALK